MESQILDLVAGVNPVPDESALLAGEGDLDAVRRLVKERSIMLQPTIETTDRRDPTQGPVDAEVTLDELAVRRNRRLWVSLAAAGVAAAVILIIVIAGGAFDSADEAPVVDAPADVVVDDGAAAMAAEAQLAAEQFVAAFEAGDVDTQMELSDPEVNGIAEHNMAEFNAAFQARGMPVLAGECGFVMGNDVVVVIECEQTITDPVIIAMGHSPNVVLPIHYRAGGIEARAWEGDDATSSAQGFGTVGRAYADYLEALYGQEYATACDPSIYVWDEIVVNNRLALTGTCGELAAAHAEDIAQWIRDGQPEL